MCTLPMSVTACSQDRRRCRSRRKGSLAVGPFLAVPACAQRATRTRRPAPSMRRPVPPAGGHLSAPARARASAASLNVGQRTPPAGLQADEGKRARSRARRRRTTRTSTRELDEHAPAGGGHAQRRPKNGERMWWFVRFELLSRDIRRRAARLGDAQPLHHDGAGLEPDARRHAVPTTWKSGMLELEQCSGLQMTARSFGDDHDRHDEQCHEVGHCHSPTVDALIKTGSSSSAGGSARPAASRT